jgi:hypothetical protein
VDSIIAATLGIKQIIGEILTKLGHYNYLISDVENVGKLGRADAS